VTNLNERRARDRGDEHLDGHLERALAGNASDAVLSELREHAKACAACAALLELGPPLASRISETRRDDVRDQRVVARALAVGPRLGRSRRVMAAVGLSAAALLLGSLATADYLGVRLPWRSHANEAPAAKGQPAAVGVPNAVPNNPPEVTAAARDEQSPAIENKPKDPAVPRAMEAPTESASELFSAANQLRRHGQDVQAISAYRRLQQAYPQSGEATLSFATLGALLLQRGDARGALTQFDSYVARGGPVLEEALAGRARALGQLGDQTGEVQAWRSLLDRFPSSVHAARAQARLTELR
jgi:TolA-binding protein